VQATTQHSLLKVKKIQTSNWARPLTPAQVAYAAADAYAALLCYHALQLRWLQLQQPEQQQQKQPGAVPLTLALPGLTQPGACFAALAAPAQLQQRWHDTVVRQGTANADTALQRACEAAAWKAEAGESALWNDVAGADTAVPPKKREVWEQTWM
jgi:ribonuclease D